LLFFVGFISSVVPNIPLVVAMVPLLKQYLVNVNLVGTEVLSPDYAGSFPPEVLPLFYAMMYGATLGGNGTLVGASLILSPPASLNNTGAKLAFIPFCATVYR